VKEGWKWKLPSLRKTPLPRGDDRPLLAAAWFDQAKQAKFLTFSG
jgi:hypothetical protein